MAKRKMGEIPISQGQKVKIAHFRLQDGGLEYNTQNEFDHRVENLFTPQVIDKPISTDGTVSGQPDWGLTGWTPANSLKITTSAGDILCDEGLAYIGGRSYVRTGLGSIKSQVDTGVGADGDYFIRIKYTISTDTHTFISESTRSANTNDVKYITLAKATVTGYPSIAWGSEEDLRSTNTSLQPSVTLSGDTDSQTAPVLTVEQIGSTENALEVLGGDVVMFTSGSPFKQVIYGNDTVALRIYSGATNYGELRAKSGSANTLVTVGNHEITGALDVTGQINGTVISGGIISTGIWQGTDIAAAYIGAHSHDHVDQGGDYPWADITGFGSEPGAVSSGSSGQAGTATTASRGDHNHDLGTHDHKSSGAGGDYPWADITGLASVEPGQVAYGAGAAGTSTVVARQDHNHDIALGLTPEFAHVTVDTLSITPSSDEANFGIGAAASSFRFTNDGGQWLEFDYHLSPYGLRVQINSGDLVWDMNLIPLNQTKDIGTAQDYWDDIFCNELNYITLDQTPWDHVDDLEIIKSVRPHATEKTKNGKPKAILTGLPKEIYNPKTEIIRNSEMTMLLIGAIKQLTLKVEELEKVIDHMAS